MLITIGRGGGAGWELEPTQSGLGLMLHQPEKRKKCKPQGHQQAGKAAPQVEQNTRTSHQSALKLLFSNVSNETSLGKVPPCITNVLGVGQSNPISIQIWLLLWVLHFKRKKIPEHLLPRSLFSALHDPWAVLLWNPSKKQEGREKPLDTWWNSQNTPQTPPMT